MIKFIYLVFSLVSLLNISFAYAESWVEEGARDFEELRLRQLAFVQKDQLIKHFVSDGCSGYQSATWEKLAKLIPRFKTQLGAKPPWESCCVAHDKLYWRGEVEDGYNARLRADQELKQCVQATGESLAPELSKKYSVSDKKIRKAFAVTADLMYKAVRLGGQPCSLLPWRWGYGWPNCAFASLGEIPAQFSTIKNDEHLTFFYTSGWLDPDKKNWNIPIHAWVYEPQDSTVRKAVIARLLEAKYELQATPDTEDNFSKRVNLLIADNEGGETIVIRIAGKDYVLPASEENGHTSAVLKLPVEVVNAFTDKGQLHFFAVTRPEEKRRFEGDVRLVPSNGISVISDIDDTIKISNVTDHKQLFDYTFFKDFEAVPGMLQLYQRLAAEKVTIHFVSSSPWQFYDPLQEFIQKAGFPAATMSLKLFRFHDKELLNLFKPGTETKPRQIEPILAQYPQRKFILIGDSGEQDPEVYSDIARRYPSQIKTILIRNVNNSKSNNERFKQAFRNISETRWKLFDDPKQIYVDKLLNK